MAEIVEKHLDGNYVDGVTFPDEIKELIHEAAGTSRHMLPLISDAIKREEQDGATGTDKPV